MADAKEIDGRDVLDDLLVHVARGRLALGLAALAAPKATVKLIGMGGGADAGRDYLARVFGAREIALGAGYLLSGREGRRLLARLGLVADVLDTASGLRTRGAVPLRASAGATAIAAGAAAVGAAKVVKDLAGR
ncbi:hypothetical protein [Spirillospora albida]|uniref:hypothetical protein n=1 Tax=Spirillospora albida TaxID=58123 RepID=UPI001FE030D3|nr:hypothetical protein [Spirillospora albida]